jgi:hypothetical protein
MVLGFGSGISVFFGVSFVSWSCLALFCCFPCCCCVTLRLHVALWQVAVAMATTKPATPAAKLSPEEQKLKAAEEKKILTAFTDRTAQILKQATTGTCSPPPAPPPSPVSVSHARETSQRD